MLLERSLCFSFLLIKFSTQLEERQFFIKEELEVEDREEEEEERMEGYTLPPGFRFYPTEEELVSFYLYHKLEGGRQYFNGVVDQIIPILDIYHFNPWDLPRNYSTFLSSHLYYYIFCSLHLSILELFCVIC